MEYQIIKAINSHLKLTFDYNGGHRLVEPYCFGVSTADNLVLRAYQIDGYSKSGKSSGWKMFCIDKIDGLRLKQEQFHRIRPDYNPDDPAMIEIIAAVEPQFYKSAGV